MKKEFYVVTIPDVLATLVGKGNVRDRLEEAVKAIFSNWAHPDLVDKIRVTKPRIKRKEEAEDG